MRPSLQRVERNDVAFLGRKEKAFLIGNQNSDDDLLLETEFNCYAAVTTSRCCCWFLFVCLFYLELSL